MNVGCAIGVDFGDAVFISLWSEDIVAAYLVKETVRGVGDALAPAKAQSSGMRAEVSMAGG